jgi:hypothetical protein
MRSATQETSEADVRASVHRHAEAIGWFLDRADDRQR